MGQGPINDKRVRDQLVPPGAGPGASGNEYVESYDGMCDTMRMHEPWELCQAALAVRGHHAMVD